MWACSQAVWNPFPLGRRFTLKDGKWSYSRNNSCDLDWLLFPQVCKNVMGIKSPLKEKENTHLWEAGKKQYESISSATHCLDVVWSHVVAYDKATKPEFFFRQTFSIIWTVIVFFIFELIITLIIKVAIWLVFLCLWRLS